ncbi:uncharacterized protein LOC142584423 [Dermacentor variabilis]|uniref:uncharacterized protein LOC142584423 n=1 Tax=Dermacentor variabilis TaxID=34621 RepID=UPI003F5BCF9B
MAIPSQCKLVVFLFAVLGGYVHCCRPFQVAQGKKLLELKGIFKEVLDMCGKVFHGALKLLPRQSVQRVVTASCRVYGTCWASLDAKTASELFDCFSAALKDQNSVFHASVNISAKQSYAMVQFMTCLRNSEAVKLPLEVVDYLAAFGRQYIYSFVWFR